MTSTVTNLTSDYLSHVTYNGLSTTIGFLAIATLMVLLLVRQLVQILRPGQAARETRALDIAVAPMLAVFTIVIVARLLDLLK